MTLQIVCRKSAEMGVIELHGWLGQPEVEELERACTTTAPTLVLDLTHLSSASAEGVLALKGLRARGARLVGASPYVALLLKDRASTETP